MHIVQSMRANIEVGTIMSAENHIVSPQNNSVVMGCVQNTLVIMYYLTNTFSTPSILDQDEYETMIESCDAYDCYLGADIPLSRLHSLCERAWPYYKKYIHPSKKAFIKGRIPGKLFVSIVFPPDFKYERVTNTNERFPIFIVDNGVILPNSGPLDKSIIGRSGGSVIHVLWKMYSPKTAANLLVEIPYLSGFYVRKVGFSMGISDCIPKAEAKAEIRSVIKNAYMQCDILETSKKSNDDKEKQINNVLNEAMSNAFKLAKNGMNKDDRNALVVMKKCGAKGSDTNNVQISGFVGQQCINGKRLNLTLPCFDSQDNTPEKRGFIPCSFLDGLEPHQHFGHAQSGRIGVISTAVKTSDSGYIQKKIGKLLEDAKISENFDCCVQDSGGNVIDFIYGGDGMDAKYVVNCRELEFPFFFNPQNVCFKVNASAKNKKGIMRCLTDEELNLLCSYLVSPIQNCIQEHATKNIHMIVKYVMKNYKVYEEVIPELFRTIKDFYDEALVKPGTMVGLISTVSIGEPSTQMTLNVFHNTGNASKDVTVGIPRLKEILNATLKPSKPTSTIYLSSEFDRDIRKFEKRQKTSTDNDIICDLINIANKFVHVTIEQLLETDIKLLYVQDGDVPCADRMNFLKYDEYKKPWWVKMHNKIFGKPRILPNSWVIHLIFNKQKLYNYNLTVRKLASIIDMHSIGKHDRVLYCIPSPEVIGEIICYINFDDLINHYKSIKKSEPLCEINHHFKVVKNVIVKFIKSISDQGHSGITNVYTRKINEQWVVDAQGSNLIQLFNDPKIDNSKTICDNMWEIYKHLGIDAVRTFIIQELVRIVSFDGTYVNIRHFEQIANEMTRTGTITRINRTGIAKDRGPLTRIMFEDSITNLNEASAFGEEDDLHAVSAAIMMGIHPPIGTNTVKVKDSLCLPKN